MSWPDIRMKEEENSFSSGKLLQEPLELFSKQDSEIFEHMHLLIKAKIFIPFHPSIFHIYDIYSFSVMLEPLTFQNE